MEFSSFCVAWRKKRMEYYIFVVLWRRTRQVLHSSFGEEVDEASYPCVLAKLRSTRSIPCLHLDKHLDIPYATVVNKNVEHLFFQALAWDSPLLQLDQEVHEASHRSKFGLKQPSLVTWQNLVDVDTFHVFGRNIDVLNQKAFKLQNTCSYRIRTPIFRTHNNLCAKFLRDWLKLILWIW